MQLIMFTYALFTALSNFHYVLVFSIHLQSVCSEIVNFLLLRSLGQLYRSVGQFTIRKNKSLFCVYVIYKLFQSLCLFHYRQILRAIQKLILFQSNQFFLLKNSSFFSITFRFSVLSDLSALIKINYSSTYFRSL